MISLHYKKYEYLLLCYMFVKYGFNMMRVFNELLYTFLNKFIFVCVFTLCNSLL